MGLLLFVGRKPSGQSGRRFIDAAIIQCFSSLCLCTNTQSKFHARMVVNRSALSLCLSKVVEQAGQWAVVRGIGLIKSTDDVANIVIGSANGTAIYVRNVAEVKLGNAFRTGVLDKNGKEAVGGVVIARYGVNTLNVIDAVKKKITALQAGLPADVHLVPFYDRTQLIQRATSTLKRALIEEIGKTPV